MKSYFLLKPRETVTYIFDKATMETESTHTNFTITFQFDAKEFTLETDRFKSSKNYTNWYQSLQLQTERSPIFSWNPGRQLLMFLIKLLWKLNTHLQFLPLSPILVPRSLPWRLITSPVASSRPLRSINLRSACKTKFELALYSYWMFLAAWSAILAVKLLSLFSYKSATEDCYWSPSLQSRHENFTFHSWQ